MVIQRCRMGSSKKIRTMENYEIKQIVTNNCLFLFSYNRISTSKIIT